MEWALFWTLVLQFGIGMLVLSAGAFILGAVVLAIKQMDEEKK
jgi:hypothetical protein